MRRHLILTATVLALLGGNAFGMLIDGGGTVTDWGVTPFTTPNLSNRITQDGVYLTIQNDYAPINYPGGVGYVPSPGGSSGEKTDLEEMYVRFHEGQLQVLTVTSSPFATNISGTTWTLGDLFLMVDDAVYGVVTQPANQGLPTGAIYQLYGPDEVQLLQPGSRSYLGDEREVESDYYDEPRTVEEIAGPWAVSDLMLEDGYEDRFVGTATVLTLLDVMGQETFDYGGAEDGTFLIEYSIDLDLLGATETSEFLTQITWGCGNDVIRVDGGDSTPVPEPGTVFLAAAGSILLLHARRRRR